MNYLIIQAADTFMFIVDDLYDIICWFPFHIREIRTNENWDVIDGCTWIPPLPQIFSAHLDFQWRNLDVLWMWDPALSCQLLAQCTIHLGPPVIFIVMFEML